ncbi:MAG TPA: hypothetical protein VMV05_07080 [bacterium]|nr:hypothetical protein [bacterium]
MIAAAPDRLKKVLILAGVLKLSALLLILLGARLFTFQDQNYLSNFHYPVGEPIGIWTLFKTWDAQHYLYLADQGYKPDQVSNAYFPLLPWLIGFLKPLTAGSGLLAGLPLSFLLALLGIGFLYRLTREEFSESTAWATCLLMLTFPMGFFNGLVYTESLFLLLLVAFFYFRKNEKLYGALGCAFLLPLSRPPGIILFILLIADWVFRAEIRKRDLAYLAAQITGLGVYFLVMEQSTGDALAGFHAHQYLVTGNLAVLSMNPLEWWSRNFFTVQYSFDDLKTSLLNRISFLGWLGSTFLAWKRLPRPYFFLLLGLGIVSAFSTELVSYSRYLSVIFPFFILLAIWLEEKALWLALAWLPLQAYFAVRHALNYWVS